MSRSGSPFGIEPISVTVVDDKNQLPAVNEKAKLVVAKILVSECHAKFFKEELISEVELSEAMTSYEFIIATYKNLLTADKYKDEAKFPGQEVWTRKIDQDSLNEAFIGMVQLLSIFTKQYTAAFPDPIVYLTAVQTINRSIVVLNSSKMNSLISGIIETIKFLCAFGDDCLAVNDDKNATDYFHAALLFGNNMYRQTTAKELTPYLLGTNERLKASATKQGNIEFKQGNHRAAIKYRILAGIARLSIPGEIVPEKVEFYKANIYRAANFLFDRKTKEQVAPVVETSLSPKASK